jgi:hypothetical protein
MTPISPVELDARRTLLVSPLDIQVFVMKIPASKKKEREEIIRSRLRTLYPGNPEDTVFAYTLSGGKRRGEQEPYDKITLFATDRGTCALYRQTGKFLIPGIAILSLGAAKIKAPSKLAILLTPEWAEAVRFEHNEIKSYVSTHRDKEAEANSWIAPLYTEAESDTLPVIIIAYPEVSYPGLRDLFKKSITAGIGEVSGGIKIKRDRIFYGYREGRFNHKRLIAALLILNCVSLSFSLRLISSGTAEELIRLQNIRTEQGEYKKEAARLQKEIAEINSRRTAARTNRGPAIYEIISEIDSCLSNARIQNLIIEPDSFSLEAEGADSIGVFRALGGSNYFYDITLRQAAPSQTGGEEFSIAGKINHERQ